MAFIAPRHPYGRERMKCPQCGYERKAGRPKKLNDASVLCQYVLGQSLAKIAKQRGVTRGAIQASLKRSAKKR